MLVKRSLLTVKIEDTYGTDSEPGVNDVVRAENVELNLSEGARMHERAAHRGSLGTLKHIYGGSLAAISFDVPIAGSGTAGTAPEFGDLLRACGLDETITASTSVSYAPVSSGIESCTIKFYEDGTLYALTGCRGNLSMAAEAGKHGVLSFNMIGHMAGPTDAAIIEGVFSTVIPPVMVGATFVIDSYAGVVSNLTMDLQNQVSMPPSVNAADGYAAIRITGRDVVGTIDPEMEPVATEDWVGNWRSGAAMAVATGSIGGTAGNRWALSHPAVSYREVSRGDRDGIRTVDLTYGAAESSGDDEATLLFT